MKTTIKRYLKRHDFGELCPKAVLFDMDGVLYDSMPNHAVAWQLSMKEFGIAMTRHDAYATEGQRGVDTIRQMAKTQLGRDIDMAEAQRMYDEKTRLFHMMSEAPVMPGALELMKLIRKMGLRIGVVTGSGQRPLIERLLRDFGKYIDPGCIVTAYDVKRGKPYPDPYLSGLKKMGGLEPWEAVVVENAPLGVRASSTARIFTCCVNTGHLPKETLLREGADELFDSMEELCSKWPKMGFGKMTISQDDRWNMHYDEVERYLKKRQQRPSKHHPEDRHMVNWIKYNRKLMSRGLLPPERTQRFLELERKAEALKRINQYAYKNTGELPLFTTTES